MQHAFCQASIVGSFFANVCSITIDFIVFVVVIVQHVFCQACIVGSFFANIT
jgi:hypothetical protein